MRGARGRFGTPRGGGGVDPVPGVARFARRGHDRGVNSDDLVTTAAGAARRATRSEVGGVHRLHGAECRAPGGRGHEGSADFADFRSAVLALNAFLETGRGVPADADP